MIEKLDDTYPYTTREEWVELADDIRRTKTKINEIIEVVNGKIRDSGEDISSPPPQNDKK